MELHPRLDPSNLLLTENKIILGSFPIWSLTPADDEKTKEEKRLERLKSGDYEFFYGSSRNQFWSWYRKFLDSDIMEGNIQSIESSLKKNNIGITDVILCCERLKKSALDKHLSKKIYNYDFFQIPLVGEKIKILCTSKGLMNNLFLTSSFFASKPWLSVNKNASDKFQHKVLSNISGNSLLVKEPFYRLIECQNGGQIECFSIPSPGSPYRKLSNFGWDCKLQNKLFLDQYLTLAFEWLQSDSLLKEHSL